MCRQACGTEVAAFYGIPYAAAPIAALRWRAPAPASPWHGVRDCDQFGDDFPQTGNALLRAKAQSEDCLYLNVWAPAQARGDQLPVLVWLHGGGFVGGSGSDVRCDGESFAAAGAIVVTLNYRSGLFGFLAHPALSAESESQTSGNYGLLDQIAALRWVRQNIAAFGGSANRVTVFGVSAGSAAISLLLTSPQARGLFQQAALHSPGACRPLASLQTAEQLGLSLGKDINAMRQWSAQELFAKTSLAVPAMRGLTTPRVLRPIRDGWLIPNDELKALDAGEFSAMPILLGSNADEGSKLTTSWKIETVAQYRELLAANFGAAVDEALAHYPVSDDTDVRTRVADLFADTQFNYGTWRLADAFAGQGAPTYRYLFSRRRPDQGDGPHHGEEVSYVFNTLALHDQRQRFAHNELDSSVARAMHSAWFRFAQSGNPTSPSNPGDVTLHWPAYERSNPHCLVFGDSLGASISLRRGWRDREIAFLDKYLHAQH